MFKAKRSGTVQFCLFLSRTGNDAISEKAVSSALAYSIAPRSQSVALKLRLDSSRNGMELHNRRLRFARSLARFAPQLAFNSK